MDRSKNRGVKVLEESLASQIAELKADLLDKDLMDISKCASSVGRIKTPSEYAMDREMALKRLIQVPKLHPSQSQSKSMSNDVEVTSQAIFTTENLPILLHQFYCDRINELIQLKHMYLVRWSRFAVGQPKVTEDLRGQFQQRIEHILLEYNDTLNRSRRLSQAVDCLLAEKAPPPNIVTIEDVMIYVRWLVYRQHTHKNTAAFIKSLQWYPMLYHKEFSLEMTASNIPSTQTDNSVKKPTGSTLFGQTPPTKPKLSSLLQHQASQFTASGGVTKLGGVAPDHKTSHATIGEKGGVTERGVGCGLPMLSTNMSDLQPLMQDLMGHFSVVGLPGFQSQSDELQLYYQVNRIFRSTFQTQEQTFTLQTYDKIPQSENGAKRQQKSKLTFRKPSKWVEFVRIRPRPDPVQIESYSRICQFVSEIDPLLSLSSHCTHLHSIHRVLYALRQHYVFVKHPSANSAPLSVRGHVTSHDSMLVWKCIYSGLDSRNPLSSEDNVTDQSVQEMGGVDSPDHAPSKGSGFDVSSAMKLINNSSGRRVSSKAQNATNDAYFAFLMLRHLKIREQRQKCLGILNYFRSIERTLTINEQGLSHDSSQGDQKPSRSTGLLDHRHLFNTPVDYIINQSEFMRYMEVENHDDFYSFESSNHVRVWDQQGMGVVYDSALKDLTKLEQELLTVGSYYMAKCVSKDSPNSHRHGDQPQDIDIGTYAQVTVDRFALLLDLWTDETKYLHAKMKVINCYMECYHHTADKHERTSLAEVVTTLLGARPRYDPQGEYFTSTYDLETKCLRLQCQLLQEMINRQMAEDRTYNENVCGGDSLSMDAVDQDATPPSLTTFGLPHTLIRKQLVSLSGDKQLSIHSFLLECAGSLGGVAGLPEAIEWSLHETAKTQNVTSVKDILTLHCQLLDVVLVNCKEQTNIGSTFSSDLQKQLFVDVIAEDPKIVADLCVTHGNHAAKEAELKGGAPKEQAMKKLQAWTNVLELTVTRHHLMLTCSETEKLTHLYKQQLDQMDHESYHAHLRYEPFDLSLRLPADKNLDYFVTKAREGGGSGDRYTPMGLRLAVNELDEKHIGVFSFRTREGMEKLLSSDNGLRSLRVSHTCQVAHRHALLVSCQHNHIILKHTLPAGTAVGGGINGSDKKLGSSSQQIRYTQAPPTSSDNQSDLSVPVIKKLKQSFISIQKEKTPVRDYMLSQFTKQPATILRNQSELENLKSTLVIQFSLHLSHIFSTFSMRVQLIHHFEDIQRLLDRFPAVKSSFFTLGRSKDATALSSQGSVYASGANLAGRKISFEKTQEMGGVKDPRQHKARPAMLLDGEGDKLMNLWYIPHFTEVIGMFSHLSLGKSRTALEKSLHLVSALHMLLQYMCAYIRLGHASKGSHDPKEVGGAWGGIESIGSELLQLQSEISRLNNPSNPDEVGQYLWLRCRVTHLAHDVTVRHNLRKTLITGERVQALHLLDSVSVPALHKLSPHTHHTHLPTPLDVLSDSHVSSLIPRQHFDSTHHTLSVSSDHTHLIGSYVYSSLASFDQLELSLAHGEILAMSLLLEDVLKTSGLPGSTIEGHTPMPEAIKTGANHLSLSTVTQQGTSSSNHTPSPVPTSHNRRLSTAHPLPTLTSLTIHTPPLEGMQLLEKFLTVASQVETMKMEWGIKLMGVFVVKSKKDLSILEEAYKERVYNVARRRVAKQQTRELARMQMETDSTDTSSIATFMTETSTDPALSGQVLESSDSLNELMLKQTQLSHLQEMLDNVMIQETSKQISKLHHLVLSERERDSTTLPLDLWKNVSVNTKEITGLSRSHLVEDLVRRLKTKLVDSGDTVSLNKTDLKDCLFQLSNGVLAREKDCYHLYASYYEALLRSQYNQLYQKNQDVEHYHCLAESNANQTREESLTFMGEHTQSLILEITALRNKVTQLHKTLSKSTNDAYTQAQQEYSQLVDNLFSATMTVKSRYEEYRGHLHGDVTRSLYEVRQSVANSVTKMKEKLGLQEGGAVAMATTGDDVAMVTRLKAEGMKDIQQENAELNKMVIKMRAVHAWNSYKASVANHHKVTTLKSQLNNARVECLELKMKTEQEINSLEQQLHAAQKSLGRVERECEVVRQSFEEERRKKSTSIKQTSKAHESSLRTKGERSKVAKFERLKQELESKEKLLKVTADEKDRSHKQSTAVKVRSSKVTRDLKHQLRHERHLKIDAFNQVDDLLAQVEEYTQQESSALRSSLYAMNHTPQVTVSSSAIPSSSKGGLANSSQTRAGRPKSVVNKPSRPGSGGETIDLSQEILALRLI